MKKSILLCCALLAMTASVAAAAGLNFSWSDCSDAGTENRTFACGANTGSSLAVGSFVAPAGISGLTGNDVVIDLQSASSALPAWWSFFNAGSCRPASLSMSLALSPTTASTCADYWSGQAAGGITSYRTNNTPNPTPAPSRARITASFGVAESFVGPIDADVEYFSFNLVVNNQKTTGTGNCVGCADPVCLVLNSINLTQGVGVGDVKISNAAARQHITWQGGIVAGGCPAATPSQNRTWGQVKALYR